MLAMITDPAQRARYLADFPEENMAALPKPRAPRAPAKPGDDLEGIVISAVGDLLRAHPRVLLAVRQNSGALPYDKDGRPVPIWFYKLVRRPEEEITITDYWGFLRDARPFAIECKRQSWKWPASPSDRELKQRAFIHMIEALGGVGGFVCSVDQAQALLP
jgi:hypothetical protein